MKLLRLALAGAALAASAALFPAAAETRETYLERLRAVCEVECLEPRYLLRKVRKGGRGFDEEVAVIMDVVEVTLWNGKFLLHSEDAGEAFADTLGSGTPDVARPVLGRNIIVIEIDEATFFDLLNVPTPQEQAAAQEKAREAGAIIVERDRTRRFTQPTLGNLRTMFRNRRIVVRGQARLEAPIVGARRDYRHLKLFIALADADQLVFLPRYNKEGEPILDGPLEGLSADYVPAGG